MLPTQVPNRFMTVTELGAPVAVHAVARWFLGLLTLVTLALFGGAGALVYMAIGAEGKDQRTWIVGAVVCAAFGILAGTLAWLRVRNTVVIYGGGFAWGKGKQLLVHRWDEIVSLTSQVTKIRVNFIPAGTNHKHTLVLSDGSKLVMTDNTISRVGPLAEHIRDQIMPRLMAQAAEAYNRGETVEFGPVVVGPALGGIQLKGRLLPWEEIESVGVNEGQFIIRKVGAGVFGHASEAVGNIPNFPVLMALLGQILNPTGE